MNEKPFPGLLALLSALLLAACSPQADEAPPLAGASIGGPFTLVNQDGKQVSDKDYDGLYRLIYFGFTYCPDICPVDLQLIGQGMRQLEKSDPAIAAKVQPIFISVDPERDTPPVVKEFVSAFHPRLVGLTGTPEQIATVAKRFGIYYVQEQQKGASGYVVNHSRIAMLFGPKGEPIAILKHDEGPDALVADLKRWVK